MNLATLTHPIAIKWDTYEQRKQCVDILDKAGASATLYSGDNTNDSITVYSTTGRYTDIAYTDLPSWHPTIHATEFITANTGTQ